MAKKKVQIILFSESVSANVTPILDSRMQPSEVVFIAITSLQQAVNSTSALIEEKGITTRTVFIDDAWNFNELLMTVSALLQNPDKVDYELNISGGNKVLAIAAYEIFKQANLGIFQVNQTSDAVVWLNNPEKKETINLEDHLSIERYFQLQGVAVTHQQTSKISQEAQRLGERWVKRARYLTKGLALLNHLASTANNLKLYSRRLSSQEYYNAQLQELVGSLEYYCLVKLEKKRLVFSSEESRAFCNGFWLEEYVFSELDKIATECDFIQDVARGVEVVWDYGNSTVRNELDVVFLANNRLFIIECKARNFLAQRKSGINTIYKMEALLHRLGGKNTCGIIASFGNFNIHNKERARLMGLCILEAEKLLDLKKHIFRIMQDVEK
ncbi:Card1-like endonuclease domain-containing protein [Zooshikella sp. RANM57]|uniref:Card1-like endonuclease domain-containing protein n=1 Tax=Zooshikella sp. RANM57 TaxID=3425863 RepID=UPI003D6F66CB